MDAQSSPLQTPFPNPPNFYTSFTTANLTRLRDLEAAASSEDRTLAAADLPEDLRVLRPPTPPEGNFTVFGEERSLAARPPPIPQDERILPAPTDPSFASDAAAASASVSASRVPAPSPTALLALTRSLLLAYLELLTALVANPSGQEYGPRWEDLRDLFRNAHAVLNAYRGWQGREKLIEVMQSLLVEGEKKERDWNRIEDNVENILRDMGLRDGLGRINVVPRKREPAEDGTEKKRRGSEKEREGEDKKEEERRRMWGLLQQLEKQNV